jgi:hypothetical protein
MSWNKRFNKLNKAGKKRKRALEKNGSTKSEAALFGSVLPKSAR